MVVKKDNCSAALHRKTIKPNIYDKFDIIITDQNMPNITGLELARQVMNIRPDTPIILFTGDDDVLNEKLVKSSGIQEILRKPLDVDILINMISRKISIARQEHNDTL